MILRCGSGVLRRRRCGGFSIGGFHNLRCLGNRSPCQDFVDDADDTADDEENADDGIAGALVDPHHINEEECAEDNVGDGEQYGNKDGGTFLAEGESVRDAGDAAGDHAQGDQHRNEPVDGKGNQNQRCADDQPDDAIHQILGLHLILSAGGVDDDFHQSDQCSQNAESEKQLVDQRFIDHEQDADGDQTERKDERQQHIYELLGFLGSLRGSGIFFHKLLLSHAGSCFGKNRCAQCFFFIHFSLYHFFLHLASGSCDFSAKSAGGFLFAFGKNSEIRKNEENSECLY